MTDKIREKKLKSAHSRNLKALRGFAGMTAKDLANRTGVPLSTIKSIETERRPLKDDDAARISWFMGLDPSSLLKGELIECDGINRYGAGSFEKRNNNPELKDTSKLDARLKKLQVRQDDAAKRLKPNYFGLYVFYLEACFESKQTEQAFMDTFSEQQGERIE